MRKLIAILFFLLPALTRGAVEWPYIGSWIGNGGDRLYLKLSTSPDLGSAAAVTNLGFFNGHGPYNSITSTSAVKLTITGIGFNPTTGATQAVSRTIWGNAIERLPDPLENTNAIYAESVTNVTLGIWLSEFVYSNDAVNVIALSGAVASTNGATFTNSADFTATATNLSTLPYDAAKCITRWSEAPYRIITNDIFYAKLKAKHRHGIASVQCIARDESGNWFTNRQTEPQLDRNGIDAVYTEKYIFPMDMSSFTNGDEIRFDFRAEPLVGTEGSVQTTLDGVNIRGPNYAPQYYRLDRLNNWGLAWAHVDPTNGTTAGVVSSNATLSGAAAFDSIGRALDACALSNAIWYGSTRSNSANARIIFAPGRYTWLSNTTSKGNPYPNPAPLFIPNPTNSSREDVWLHQSINSQDPYNKRYHVHDMVVGFTNTLGFSSAVTDHLFLDRVTINNTSTLFGGVTNSYTIGCVVSNLPGGWGGTAHAPQIIAGNWLYNTNNLGARTYMQYGNRRMVNMGNAALGAAIINTALAGTAPQPDRAIVEGNLYYGLNITASAGMSFYDTDGCTNGAYFGNNIIENTNRSITTAIANFASSSPNTNSTNIIIEGNVILGGRILFAYNSDGSSPWYRTLFTLRNNLIDDFNIKTDVFTPGDGSRIGNWPVVFGVGVSGNYSPDAGFPPEFRGLNSYMEDLSNPTNWFQFANFGAAVVGAVSGPGQGDYRLLNKSPIPLFNSDSLRRFDVDGKPIGNVSRPGAISQSGEPRIGGLF